MKLHVAIRVPTNILSIEDSFSQELVKLWKERGMSGKIFWYDDQETVVSYVMVEEGGEINTIRGFYTTPLFRGKGLGSELLETVYSYYEALGARGMVVNITEGAEKVYEKQGYTILGTRKDFPDQKIAIKGILTEQEQEKLKKKIKQG